MKIPGRCVAVLLVIFPASLFAFSSTVVNAAAGTLTQSVMDTGLMIYFQKAGLHPTLVNTSNGSYVVPSVPPPHEPSSPTQNIDFNNQANKQAFFDQ